MKPHTGGAFLNQVNIDLAQTGSRDHFLVRGSCWWSMDFNC